MWYEGLSSIIHYFFYWTNQKSNLPKEYLGPSVTLRSCFILSSRSYEYTSSLEFCCQKNFSSWKMQNILLHFMTTMFEIWNSPVYNSAAFFTLDDFYGHLIALTEWLFLSLLLLIREHISCWVCQDQQCYLHFMSVFIYSHFLDSKNWFL